MKTVAELVKQQPIFLGRWRNKEGVVKSFWEKVEQKGKIKPEEANILFASYERDIIGHGAAYVLFEKNGKLYETDGRHCSCRGLEGQWRPDEVSLKEFEHRLLEGTFAEEEEFKEKLCSFLGVAFKKNGTGFW